MGRRSVAAMLKFKRSIVSMLARRFRGRAVVELENLALRHQLHVLRRQRPGRPRLFAIDRLLWVSLYRLWPRCLKAMVLVKPTTVIKWHRQGFHLFWRWRSRSGRPSVEREIRDLIRQMSSANPLWGAPRIHGELLKLGIEISQATVAKYMVRRRGTPPYQTWRTFLRNQAQGIAAIDMFVVASASFRLFYVMIILAHDRRNIVRTAVTEHPTAAWLSRQVTEAFPWDTAPLLAARSRRVVWRVLPQPGRSDGDHGGHHGATLTLAERLRRARDRFDSPRVFGSPRDLQRPASAPRPVLVRRLLPTHPHASFARHCPDSRTIMPRRIGKVIAIHQVAGLTVTNVSPPDSDPIPASSSLRHGQYAIGGYSLYRRLWVSIRGRPVCRSDCSSSHLSAVIRYQF